MASKKTAGRPKKQEMMEGSSEDEQPTSKYNPKGKAGKMQKTKSSEKMEESKKAMPPKEKVTKTKVKAQEDSDSDDMAEYAKPKKGLTSFFIFLKERREQYIKENPDSKPKDVTKELSKVWNKMTDNEKSEFVELAEKDKERYQRQLEEFNTHGKFYDDDGNVVKVEKKRRKSMSKKSMGQKKKPMQKKK